MARWTVLIVTLSMVLVGRVATEASQPLALTGQPGNPLLSAHSRSNSTMRQRRRRRRRPALRPGKLIPRKRVREIQRALIERGFLKKESGVYDRSTVEAMKAFQASEDIRVTGYPTARALGRLGLPLGPTAKRSKAPAAKPATEEAQQPGKP